MKFKYCIIISALLILQSVGLKAQNSIVANDLTKMSKAKKIKEGDYLYNSGSYYNAILYYESAFEDDNTNADIVNQIATGEYALRDYVAAEKWYKILNNLKSNKFPQAAYQLGVMQKYNAKYDEAKKTFESFQRNYKGYPDASIMKKKARDQIRGCDLAKQMIASPNPKVVVSHLGKEVNSPYTEMAPIAVNDTTLLYSALKADSVIILGATKKRTTTQFFVSNHKDSVYKPSSVFDASFNNSSEYNNGNGSLTKDGKRLYFSRATMDKNLKYHAELYVSELKDGKWSSPEKLPAPINDPAYNSTQPAVENDKNGEVIYYSCDRSDGAGSYDIWYVVHTMNGGYSNPINAGKKINTYGNEITPYYDSKNSILYYSSDGEVGMGGQDIFRSKGSLNKFTNPENLGYPINSSDDDMYYSLDRRPNRGGYLVSNRPGTISVKSPTCCDDIWRVKLLRTIHYSVRGYVYDVETRKKLDSVTITMLNNGLKLADELSSSQKKYFFNLKPEYTYAFSVQKTGYFSNSEILKVLTKDEDDTIRLDIPIKKIPITVIPIHNIYYDFDHCELRPESKPGLDSLFDIMTQNPGIRIEIGSHTDNKGNVAYNMKLSQCRAQSVVDFLISKRIDKDRMIAKGYGPTKPLCAEMVKDPATGKMVDDPECRQRNRRTELKIIGNIPNATINYKVGDIGYDPKKDEKVDNGDDIKFFQIDKDKNESEDKDIDKEKTAPKDKGKSNKPK